jgi:hypothetical protein
MINTDIGKGVEKVLVQGKTEVGMAIVSETVSKPAKKTQFGTTG